MHYAIYVIIEEMYTQLYYYINIVCALIIILLIDIVK